MAIQPGTRLGPYEIVSSLGAGAMGEVYRARDTQLNRDVAIKVLPELFAADPERLARFTREAQTLAALNHPNIAHIHGLEGNGAAGKPRALVMELVEGEDLSALIARGPVPATDALAIARQIADALEAAHEVGIVHRDLKPANIKVRTDGTVKVLDFGLAKAMDSAAVSSVDALNSPTLTARATQMGVIIGTAAYMAPEQARGKPVDKRADIWAFGCVLYEMLTGRQAFAGDSVTDVIAAIVKEDPDWGALPPDTPVHVRSLQRRCLQKDLKRRFRDIGDVRLQLDDADGGSDASAIPATRRASRLPWSVAAVCALAAMAIGIAAWRRVPPPNASTIRLLVRPPVDQSSRTPQLALSPDGSFLVYHADRLYIRRFSEFTSQPLPGTENAISPFVSLDGRWVGFYSEGQIKKVAVAGGTPVVVGSVDPDTPGAAWGPENRIYFSPGWIDSTLASVSADGGATTQVSTLNREAGERGHWWPHPLPDGRHLLFTILQAGAGLSDAKVAALDLQTGKHRVLFPGAMARYAAGQLLYYRAGGYNLVPFNVDTLAAEGEPMPVLPEALGLRPEGNRSVPLSMAPNGTVAYFVGDLSSEIELIWVSRLGRQEPTPVKIRAYQFADLSADGRRVAVGRLQGGTAQVWITDLETHAEQRLSAAGTNFDPIWHPDGQRLSFISTRKGDFDIFVQRPDGTPEQQLEAGALDELPTAWLPDGRGLIAETYSPDGTSSIVLLDLDKKQRSTLVAGPFEKAQARVSPDGRWLAIVANAAGAWHVHVRPIVGGASFRQITTGDVGQDAGVRWSPRGQELFVMGRSELVGVTLAERGGDLIVLKRRVIAEFPRGTMLIGVSPDGERVLVGKPITTAGPSSDGIHVVINGLEALKLTHSAAER